MTATPTPRSARETRSHQLMAVLHAYPHTPLAEKIEKEYIRITEADQLPNEVLADAALFEAEQRLGESPLENAADELLRAFEEAVIREAYQEAVVQLRRAESSGSASQVAEAQALCSKLSARLSRL